MPKKKSSEQEDSNSKTGNPKTAPQVNDIAKPGETPAPATSRPVITGHGPMVKQDPMVSGGADDDGEDIIKDKPGIVDQKSETTIRPDKDFHNKPEEKTEKKSEEESEQKKTSESPEESIVKEEETVEDKKDDADSEVSNSDSAAIDSLATSVEAKKLDAKQAEEKQKIKEKIEQLKDEKKYYVPIVEGGHKASSQRFATWIFLILLLAAVLIYLLIDAGYLDVGVSLPFDLIKN